MQTETTPGEKGGSRSEDHPRELLKVGVNWKLAEIGKEIVALVREKDRPGGGAQDRHRDGAADNG